MVVCVCRVCVCVCVCVHICMYAHVSVCIHIVSHHVKLHGKNKEVVHPSFEPNLKCSS